MIEQANLVRSYVFLLDHMIGDRPYKWPWVLNALSKSADIIENFIDNTISWTFIKKLNPWLIDPFSVMFSIISTLLKNSRGDHFGNVLKKAQSE